MIKGVLLAVFLTATLTACTAIQTPLDEGYTFGDTYRSVYTLQQTYCASTDPAQQALYRGLLKRLYGDYPSEGACTDILEVLNSYEDSKG